MTILIAPTTGSAVSGAFEVITTPVKITYIGAAAGTNVLVVEQRVDDVWLEATFSGETISLNNKKRDILITAPGLYRVTKTATPKPVGAAIAYGSDVGTFSISGGFPNCAVGVPYTAGPLPTVNAVGPVTWAINNQFAGLTLDANTGIMAGTPLSGGTSVINPATVTATDSLGREAQSVFVWLKTGGGGDI